MDSVVHDPLAPWRVASFAMSAGASLALALLAVPMAFATRCFRVWGTLALVGFLAFVYLGATIGFLVATTPAAALAWARASLVPAPCVVCGLWVLCTQVPAAPRHLVTSRVHVVVLVVMTVLTVAALADLAIGTGWVVAGVETLPGTLRYRVLEPGPLGSFLFVLSLLVLYAAGGVLVVAWRSAPTPSISPVAAGTLLYFATLTNDLLLVFGVYDGPFLNQFGLFAMYAGFCVYFGHTFVENAEALRRAHEELQRHRRAAAHVSRLRSMGTLAAFVTHELGNDLQIIENISLSLIHARDARLEDAELGDLRLATRHMASVLRSLRRLSRESNEHDPMEPIRLADVADDAARLLAPLMRRYGIRLRVQPSPGADDTVHGRVPELLQVAINLLKNAADAVQEVPEPTVTVSVHATDEQVLLRVADNGPGVPDDVRDRIFEPFFTTKASDEGTGIGLAVVQQIVVDHGGSIRLERRDGETVFEVVLPRAQPAAPASGNGAAPSAETSSSPAA